MIEGIVWVPLKSVVLDQGINKMVRVRYIVNDVAESIKFFHLKLWF